MSGAFGPYQGVRPSPSGLPCRKCGRTTSSAWRGPGMRWCAKSKCSEEARQAREALNGGDDKEERIEKLEEVVAEQADAIAALQGQLSHLTQLLHHRLGSGSDADGSAARSSCSEAST